MTQWADAGIERRRKSGLSGFRTIAPGTWRTAWRAADDPSVHGSLTLCMEQAERHLDELRRATGKRWCPARGCRS